MNTDERMARIEDILDEIRRELGQINTKINIVRAITIGILVTAIVAIFVVWLWVNDSQKEWCMRRYIQHNIDPGYLDWDSPSLWREAMEACPSWRSATPP